MVAVLTVSRDRRHITLTMRTEVICRGYRVAALAALTAKMRERASARRHPLPSALRH